MELSEDCKQMEVKINQVARLFKNIQNVGLGIFVFIFLTKKGTFSHNYDYRIFAISVCFMQLILNAVLSRILLNKMKLLESRLAVIEGREEHKVTGLGGFYLMNILWLVLGVLLFFI